MWPRSQAGTADETDYFTLSDAPSMSNSLAERRKMGVQGFVSVWMTHDNHISIAALSPNESDMAIGSCSNACAGRCAVINAFMGSPFLEHRMKTCICESGSHA